MLGGPEVGDRVDICHRVEGRVEKELVGARSAGEFVFTVAAMQLVVVAPADKPVVPIAAEDRSRSAAGPVEAVIAAAKLNGAEDLARIDNDIVAAAVGVENASNDQAAVGEGEAPTAFEDSVGGSLDDPCGSVGDHRRQVGARVNLDASCADVSNRASDQARIGYGATTIGRLLKNTVAISNNTSSVI